MTVPRGERAALVLQAESKFPRSNLHTHTVYSDGAGTVEENILAAIDKGFVSIGISDHSYTDFDLTYCMKQELEDAYVSEIFFLKEKYKDRIDVYCGLELDGYSKINKALYDYTIGSCHYIKTCDGYFSVDHSREDNYLLLERYFDHDKARFARAYFDTVSECITRQSPDIIGHFDLVSKYGVMDEDSPIYLSLARNTLATALEITPFIEINTGAIARGVRSIPYPAPYLWRDVKELGGRFVLSSDSHKCQNLDFGFDDSAQLLREHGFDKIYLMKDGCLSECYI